VPVSLTSAGREVVELAGSCGLILDEHQQLVLEAFLGERPDGRWATFQNVLIEPRQNGKGAILEARELAGLFYFREPLIVHCAHEFKTAKEGYRRISTLIRQSDELERQVRRRLENNNGMLIELRNGCRLVFLARSTGSGRGFTGDVVILDEAYNLSDRMVEALIPTMSARPNPQLWMMSSAPLPEDYSGVLRRVCARGRHGDERSLAYLEWCAADDVGTDDREAWRAANPALGLRISEEFVEWERGLMSEEGFRRERLGVWEEEFGLVERVIPEAVWEACLSEASTPAGDVVFGVDVEADRSRAAIVVAAPSSAGGVHVEVVDYRLGTDWLVDKVGWLLGRWGAPVLLGANSPAASLLPELAKAGIEPLEVPTVDLAKACGLFYDLAHRQQLAHVGQAELSVAVAGAERRYLSDAWVWARRTSDGIAPLVAATLAVWGAHRLPPKPVEPWAVLA
jgi:hypothetical protein